MRVRAFVQPRLGKFMHTRLGRKGAPEQPNQFAGVVLLSHEAFHRFAMLHKPFCGSPKGHRRWEAWE